MQISKKIPKPLLGYFIAFICYSFWGFISTGCDGSTAGSCQAVPTNMTVETPDHLLADGTDMDCILSILGTSTFRLVDLSWRCRILVLNPDNTPYSRRDYNSNFNLPNVPDNNAIIDYTHVSLVVPSCGEYKIQITLQSDLQDPSCARNDPSYSPSSPAVYMTWISTSGPLQGASIVWLLGDQIANEHIEYAELRPII